MAMETFVYNIAKGRVAEFLHRVDSDDPSTSLITLVPLSVGDTQANCQDFATLAATLTAPSLMVAAAADWPRKQLTQADVTDIVANNTSNYMPATLPQVTWTAPTTNIVGLLVCYDALGTNVNSSMIPMTAHVLAVTGDGNDVVLNAGDFFQAS